jgi:N-acetylmuramoyl-L-alanine amidase
MMDNRAFCIVMMLSGLVLRAPAQEAASPLVPILPTPTPAVVSPSPEAAPVPKPPPRPARRVEDGWTLIFHEGRDYVLLKEVAAFYRFAPPQIEGYVVTLKAPTMELRFEQESVIAQLGENKHYFVHEVIKHQDEWLLARVDLVRTLDPVLRPAYLENWPDFDTIILDPGHGGLDNGTRGLYGDEKDYAYDLALRLRVILKKAGYRVLMTREEDIRLRKHERIAMANQIPRSLFVSLHFNNDRSRTVQGIETYVLTPQSEKSTNDRRLDREEAPYRYAGHEYAGASQALARAVHGAMVRDCRATDRGVRYARWAVIKHLKAPGILIEGGYISHPVEGSLVNVDLYRQTMATAIAKGIFQYQRAYRRARGEE